MPKFKLTAAYIDTCLPCYLRDSYTREGEMLLYTTPVGQSAKEAAEELWETFDCDAGFPKTVSDIYALSVLTEACRNIDFRYIDADGERLEIAPDGVYEDDSADEMPYVYVVLRWREVSC